MDKYVSWSTWSILDLYYIMNMYVDPYQLICRMYTHKNYSCARNQIWTGDTRIFSPLLYQLSYPDHYRRIIFILLDGLGRCQLKKTQFSIKSLGREIAFLEYSKRRLCKFQYEQWDGLWIIHMEIPCSKVFISTCILYTTRLVYDKRKNSARIRL